MKAAGMGRIGGTIAAALLFAADAQTPTASFTLIRSARVVDGTGIPARAADVRVSGDRIVAVGQLTASPNDRIVDAGGLTLAPGFIDTHSHHDRGLDSARDALAMVSQGVTTIVVGQDGGGSDLAGLFARLEQHPASVNVASYAGHGAIRRRVLGDDFKRPATAAEVERMKPLLKAEMDAGALGLSTGLEYDPGIYSSKDEVLALAKVAADSGGRYISHMRSEDRWFWDALDELIAIGRTNHMPVQVSHIKLGMHDLWGQAEKLVGVLDRARADGVQVTADIYPYTYWQSNLGVLYPKRNYADEKETDFVLAHVALADDIIFNSFRAHPEYAGKTLAQVAEMRHAPAARTLMALLAEPGGENAGIIAKGMAEGDVERLLQWPFANVCSDGQSTGLHPLGFGSFAKVAGPYVRDRRLFTLEEAVRKMTTLAAANVGITHRGRIAAGEFADLVLFDPALIADRADFGHAQDQAVGVSRVWVNGEVVFQAGKATNAYPGRPLRRTGITRNVGQVEAISIKPAVSVDIGTMRMRVLPNGDLSASAVPVVLLVGYAYDVPVNPSPRLSGLPPWQDRYDIEAKAAANGRTQEMIRRLLADRFKLVMRVEQKTMPVYALTVASGGPKLQKAAVAEKDCVFDTAPDGCHTFMGGRGHPLNARAITMDDLARYIENWTDLPVVNRTALSGLFAVNTEGWLPMRLPPPPPGGNPAGTEFDGLPTLFTVLRTVGLELHKQEGTVPVYTVEHIERPANVVPAARLQAHRRYLAANRSRPSALGSGTRASAASVGAMSRMSMRSKTRPFMAVPPVMKNAESISGNSRSRPCVPPGFADCTSAPARRPLIE